MRTGHHSKSSCHFHLILVTKYRHKCLTASIRDELKTIITDVIGKKGVLEEFNGEEDHIHLLMELPPHVLLSTLVNSIKCVSSRLIRARHPEHFKPFYWKPILWSRSYFVLTSGGASIDVIKKYIQSQGRD